MAIGVISTMLGWAQIGLGQTANSTQLNELGLLESVRAAVADNPQLKSEHVQVEIVRGVARQAAGPFDFRIASGVQQQRQITELTSYDKTAYDTTASTLIAEVSTYTLQGQETYRNGLSLAPVFTLTRTVDNLLNPTGTNTASGVLQLTIPLLQSRGRSAVDAQEIADHKEVEATLEDERQTLAQLIAKTAADYWNLVAAYRVVAIDKESEDRGVEYLDNVRQLVGADVVPHNDIHAVTANVELRRATREVAELQLVAARQQLFTDMGTDAAGMLAPIAPAEDFPSGAIQDAVKADSASMQMYLRSAESNRGDYRAELKRIEEQGILRTGAKTQLLPQLNVTAAAGYVGQQEGRQLSSMIQPAYSGTRAPVATLGINYSFPIGNDTAKGQLAQVMGAERQAKLGAVTLEQTLNAAIVNAVLSVNKSIVETQHAQQAVESYRSALEGERDKYRFGTGSIVSILTVEDSLTNAMLNLVQTQTAYAQAITQFRFVTGSLIEPDTFTPTLSEDTFLSLPSFASTPRGPEQLR
jgi:outer membrane protein TolC